MSVKFCVNGKIGAGKLDDTRGTQLLDLVDELEQQYRSTMSDESAARQAALDAADIAEKEAARKRRLVRLTVTAQARARTQILSHPKGPRWGAISMLTRDIWELAPWHNVDKLRAVIRAEAHALFAKGLDTLGPGFLGIEASRARNRDILKAIFGEGDASAAAGDVARSWKATTDHLRRRFNNAGGNIGELDTFHLPQRHDALKVGSVSFQAWREFIQPKLDRSRMLDTRTGRVLDDARLELVLREVYESISTGGLSKTQPSAQARGRAMANRRGEQRVLHFKRADDWMAYQQQFGTGGVFEVMTDHIERLANDVAWLEIFGPNPAATQRFVADLIDRHDAAGGAGVDVPVDADGNLVKGPEARAAAKNARGRNKLLSPIADWRDVWDDVSGVTASPANPSLARSAQNVRSWLVASQLGSAMISALSDNVTNMLTGYMNGIPPAKILGRSIRQMVEPGAELNAVELGLLGDDMARIAGAASRFGGEILHRNTMSRIADVTLRASLLRRWTAAGRHAFGVEFSALLGRNRNQAFQDLPDMLQQSFERYGIGADQWDVIRQAKLYEPQAGARFLRPMDVAAVNASGALDAAQQLHRMVLQEMDYAVVTTDPLTRAIWHRGTQAGTAKGEGARLVAMYKSFPTTVITTHLMRATMRPTTVGKVGYAGTLFIGMTLFGMMAFQAKQVSRGKDPVTTDPLKPEGRAAWAAAMLQGGGLGIIGDFAFADQSRFGNDLAVTIAGPAAGLADDVFRDFMVANIQRGIRGEETDFAGDALWLATRYTPGSSLWYLRLALEREVFDQAALMIDPKAPQRFRRAQRRARKDLGQRYWLPPGQHLSSARRPDFSEVVK